MDGGTLRGRLARDHELPVDKLVSIWREMLDALSHAHGRGIVHRDIKPEKVLMSRASRGFGRWWRSTCRAVISGATWALACPMRGRTAQLSDVAD